jgi:hypothetical protein
METTGDDQLNGSSDDFDPVAVPLDSEGNRVADVDRHALAYEALLEEFHRATVEAASADRVETPTGRRVEEGEEYRFTTYSATDINGLIEDAQPGGSPGRFNLSREAIEQVVAELQDAGVVARTATRHPLHTISGNRIELAAYPLPQHIDSALVVRYDSNVVKDQTGRGPWGGRALTPVAIVVLTTERGDAFEGGGDKIRPTRQLLHLIKASRIQNREILAESGQLGIIKNDVEPVAIYRPNIRTEDQHNADFRRLADERREREK